MNRRQHAASDFGNALQKDLHAASEQVQTFTSKLEVAEKMLKEAESKLSAAEKDSADTRFNLEQVDARAHRLMALVAWCKGRLL